MNSVAPEFGAKAFNCPRCGAYAKQNWKAHSVFSCCCGITEPITNTEWFHFSTCECCDKSSVWHNRQLIHPQLILVEPPNPDLENEIISDYNEAAAILQQSPRGASAILRLAAQKICKQLGEDGKNLNSNIASLVKKGLSPDIQKSLDILRVIGNNAVHPGEISVDDTPEIALALFRIINKIADTMITDKKEIDAIYNSLPDKQKESIKRRDS